MPPCGLRVHIHRAGASAVHINEINNDGTIGTLIESDDWTSGWSTAEPYVVNNDPHLFLLKSGTGEVKIYSLNPDGRVGQLEKEYDWREGWTSATFYHVNT